MGPIILKLIGQINTPSLKTIEPLCGEIGGLTSDFFAIYPGKRAVRRSTFRPCGRSSRSVCKISLGSGSQLPQDL